MMPALSGICTTALSDNHLKHALYGYLATQGRAAHIENLLTCHILAKYGRLDAKEILQTWLAHHELLAEEHPDLTGAFDVHVQIYIISHADADKEQV